jgi:hypothetical protein
MWDSNHHESPIGFSTGALQRGDYTAAIRWLSRNDVNAVELSALRLGELSPLIRQLDSIPIAQFHYVSFHAPSAFAPEDEETVVDLLGVVYRRGWNIVVHPDVIRHPALWQRFGRQLLIENMDRRKPTGRTVSDLEAVFRDLPEARMCLDVAHARQLDTTLTLLIDLIRHFWDRIAEIHISELDSHCHHYPMSWLAVRDYRTLPWHRLQHVPVIIEAMLDEATEEARQAELALTRKAITAADSP